VWSELPRRKSPACKGVSVVKKVYIYKHAGISLIVIILQESFQEKDTAQSGNEFHQMESICIGTRGMSITSYGIRLL
jgi:hypothetical protein